MAGNDLVVSVDIRPNIKVMSGLKVIPDRVMRQVARETLDRAYPIIPMSPPGAKTRGQLRKTSMAGGIRGSNGNYYIGSYTSYAKYVWKMHDVNWTTPGTDGQWYARAIQRHGQTIINNAINKAWRDVM